MHVAVIMYLILKASGRQQKAEISDSIRKSHHYEFQSFLFSRTREKINIIATGGFFPALWIHTQMHNDWLSIYCSNSFV